MARIDKKGEGILKQKIKHFYMICYVGVYICYVGDTFYHKCGRDRDCFLNKSEDRDQRYRSCGGKKMDMIDNKIKR